MTATDVGIPPREGATASPPRASRRRIGSRLSTGHVVMIVAGLVAAMANLAVVRAGSATVPVVVARADIPIGVAVTPDLLRTVDARLDADVLATLVTPASVRTGALEGHVTATPVRAGSPLRLTDLRPAATGEPGLRRIAIPVRPEAAVGGAIEVDDRIDVIQVVDGEPRYLVSNARVLARAERTGTALGAVTGFHVTIGVDAETALCLAAAIESGGLTLVLSTGQEPVSVSPCLAAGEGQPR
ncbi:MAG: hypothetical protein KY461_11845 [Actinobacteria bacterium]|nr:hypothetical protein [Actinomycetota bacterium]